MTDISRSIRDALASVARLREQTATQAAAARAVTAVKQFQAQRFAGTYADLLGHPDQGYGPAAHFFLTELYSAKDYTERDAQFSRIAGAIDRLFPQKVGALALALARLHALTEELDHAMGQAWLAAVPDHPNRMTPAQQAARYTAAWRHVGRPDDRYAQLHIVLGIGTELARLTRLVGLRSLLRMMRGPAHAAGLQALQVFLESGFDTFADLAKLPGGVQGFLSLIEGREKALLDMLFEADAVSCGTNLQRTLGQAP